MRIPDQLAAVRFRRHHQAWHADAPIDPYDAPIDPYDTPIDPSGYTLRPFRVPATAPCSRRGVRWTPRYFVRRLAWHELDHTWEIEDRAT